jgi:TonB-linked SusC/RagA family outer membrane protein
MKKVLTLFFVLVCVCSAMAQRTLTGKVTDPQGEPLIGATVLIKGSNAGSITDVDGNYTIKTDVASPVLVISYSGYKTQEVTVGSSNVTDVTLPEGLIIEEAVITAFGIKKDKSNLGYSIGQIKAEELTTARTTNVTNALAAKVAGVRVSGSGGSFTGSSVIIRGFTTFTGSNQPLYVVDGIPIDNSGGASPLQNGPSVSNRAIDLNQEDIENISVLKGAAATALYGSRAASGVILITTKKGSFNQKGRVTYNANYAIQEVNRLPDYQNIYGQGAGGVFNPTAISSWGPRINGQRVSLPADYRAAGVGDSVRLTAYPDNVAELFQRGPNMQHNVSFEGGSQISSYRLSLGYLQDQGVLANNRLRRYNVSFNNTTQITSKLTAGISLNYSLNKSIRTQQGNQLSNPLFRSWFTPRSWDLTGLPYATAAGTQLHYDPLVDNPRWTIEQNKSDDQIDRVFGNVNLSYGLASWLQANYRVGVDFFGFNRRAYDQIGARGAGNTSATPNGGIVEQRFLNRNINSYLTFVASHKFGKLDVNAVAGNEIIDEYLNETELISRGLVVRDFRDIDANTPNPTVPAYRFEQGRILGVFGNVTFGWDSWVTIDLSVRNDWNSTLRKGNNSYLYYSGAASVELTNAIKGLKSDWLSQLKLRGGWGRVGRASLKYSTDTYFSTANPADGFGPNIVFPFNNIAGSTLNNTAGNPDLQPEFLEEGEFGFDATFVKNIFSLEFTRYNRHSTNIILNVPNSPAAGFSAVAKNAGSLRTKGVEARLTLRPIQNKNLQWEIDFNYTQFRSIVEELAPGVQNIALGGFTTPNIRLVAGDEYGQIYGNKYLRDDQGRLRLTAAGLPQPTPNVDKIGNPNARWTAGINNSVTYKGLNLTVLLDIRQGGDQYSRNIADIQRNGVGIETAEFERFNTDGTVARPYRFDGVFPDGVANEGAREIRLTPEQYWGNGGKYVAAEGFIYNTSWQRIREASLSYSLPKTLLKNLPFSALDIGLFGRNLFLRAPNYPHLDPEQNALGISNAQGLEFNALPQTRSYGANLRVVF